MSEKEALYDLLNSIEILEILKICLNIFIHEASEVKCDFKEQEKIDQYVKPSHNNYNYKKRK